MKGGASVCLGWMTSRQFVVSLVSAAKFDSYRVAEILSVCCMHKIAFTGEQL